MAVLTTAQADKLNRLTPTTQEMALGTSIKESQDYQAVILTYTVAADASTAVTAFIAPFAMRIVDIIVKASATQGSGTIAPFKGSDAICTAIACAADGAVTHMSAGATTDARLVLAAGDLFKVQSVGGTAANTRGVVTVIGARL